jgi:hypothetical protein
MFQAVPPIHLHLPAMLIVQLLILPAPLPADPGLPGLLVQQPTVEQQAQKLDRELVLDLTVQLIRTLIAHLAVEL